MWFIKGCRPRDLDVGKEILCKGMWCIRRCWVYRDVIYKEMMGIKWYDIYGGVGYIKRCEV